MRSRFLPLVLAAVLLVAGSAQANSGDYYTEERPYYVKIFAKLGRGLSNVSLCWTELYTQSYKEGLRATIHGETVTDIGVGTGTGFVVGIGYTAMRLGVGIFDTVSFPIPTRPLMRTATPAVYFEDLPASVGGGVTLPRTHR